MYVWMYALKICVKLWRFRDKRWLEVTGSPRTEMFRGAPKPELLIAGDEFTTKFITFLMAGY